MQIKHSCNLEKSITKKKGWSYQMPNEGNVKQSFPQFTLQNMNGEFVSLKDYAGKPLIIFMWSSW
ncbi:MAG: hypothetical protein CM1200mP3_15470 [Chloroflexota bacterium]|nr:MAG: hypothetical protein CM1200mP3_15470 [Chloroflexota bacterium]